MAEELKKNTEEQSQGTQVVASVKKEVKEKSHNNKENTERRPRQFSPKKELPTKQYEEKVIDIARVTTVVKGGRRFSFSAYVVVGDKKGKVGFGHGKANEVQDAIKKAVKDATKNVFSVPVVNGTIPHEIQEKFLASRIQLRPAPKGAGIIASNTVRAVVELAGYTDISTKTYGSRTKQNIVQAAIKALKKVRTVEEIAKLRDIDVKHLTSK
ncbi:30S ribosomal protein S5 [Mycoplasma struthionis]|uniref:Small ribosomal subunit protein uS5 n=1 Tax=Mycoplasma struthionis TaxID=538220 RepID=A0A502M7H8_9MOLU|nr:30S ribosomal protein S5 [Mycoplasma struthionis]TPI01865.1 30S ribosomal protein S5 [Mycoplasma struthionis]